MTGYLVDNKPSINNSYYHQYWNINEYSFIWGYVGSWFSRVKEWKSHIKPLISLLLSSLEMTWKYLKSMGLTQLWSWRSACYLFLGFGDIYLIQPRNVCLEVVTTTRFYPWVSGFAGPRFRARSIFLKNRWELRASSCI